MDPTRSKRPVMVVSLDGVNPALVRRADELGIGLPNLRELKEAGASAQSVESVYPSTTYPAHATLVTGVPPRRHGIYSHLASLDPTERARAWHWFAQPLRVPALWNSARAIGLKTAAVGWPVSAGAPVDFNIPEIWDPALPNPSEDFQTVARHTTPGLFEELVPVLTPIFSLGGEADRLRAEAALSIWSRHTPDLLLLHLVEYDGAAHLHGPQAPEALRALERADREIGRLREAAAGRAASFVALSDHGFVPVDKDAAPLVALADESLFVKLNDTAWELRRLGAVHAGGSFALYWLEKPSAEDRRALDRALARLKETGAIAEMVDRAGLEKLDSDPDAEMILDAAPGYHFSDRFDGPLVRPSVHTHGTHGQLPTRPGMEAMFVAAGEPIARGKNLGRLTLVQVGRALSHLAGLPAETLAPDFAPVDFG